MADDRHIVNHGSVIEVDEDGDIVGTRLHPALLGPVDIEPEFPSNLRRVSKFQQCRMEYKKCRFRDCGKMPLSYN